MKINKDTRIYASFSSNPGNLGCKRFNNAFEKNEIDAIYYPFKIEDFNEAIKAAKTLNIAGAAISMPFKIIAYLKSDILDETSKIAGSVNTILFEKNKIIGFNTDYLAIQDYLNIIDLKYKDAIIIGTGAFSKSAYIALNNKNIHCNFIPRYEINKIKLENITNKIIFNATPIDISNNINKQSLFIDCLTSSNTGKQISFFGARRQFYDIYSFSKNYIFEEI